MTAAGFYGAVKLKLGACRSLGIVCVSTGESHFSVFSWSVADVTSNLNHSPH